MATIAHSDVDPEVAGLFAQISRQLGALESTARATLAQTKKTNGHVADAFVEIDKLKQVNAERAGAEKERRKFTKGATTFALVFGTLFGGALTVEFAKLVG